MLTELVDLHFLVPSTHLGILQLKIMPPGLQVLFSTSVPHICPAYETVASMATVVIIVLILFMFFLGLLWF